MDSIKIFRRHNINQFTGIDSGVPGVGRYQYTKSNGEVVTCGDLSQFMNEDNKANFLGWHTKDMRGAFPFCKYETVEQALDDFGFEWHESVSHLVSKTQYSLIDPNSLKCTAHFKSDLEYNIFNRLVEQNALAHGYKEYKLGIFYERA